jgi:DNA-binding MarR family transcriptional regulator
MAQSGDPTSGSAQRVVNIQRLADLIVEVCRLYRFKQDDLAAGLSLTGAEFRLILAMGCDPCSAVGELALRMELSNSRLTRILDGLVKKKIVDRESLAHDRRMRQVVLTEKGGRVQKEVHNRFMEAHEDLVQLMCPVSGPTTMKAIEDLQYAMKKWVKSRNVPVGTGVEKKRS